VTSNRPDVAEVTEAELDALVHELEESREQISEAIRIAAEATERMQGSDLPDDDCRSESQVRAGMLWNTVGIDRLSDSRL